MKKHVASHRGAALSDPGLKRLIQAYHNDPNAAVVEDFKFRPGFIYTSVRAISARVNQNYDAWPSEELEKSYRTFLGKPCFVNHQNFDPSKARGRVVAARYVESGRDKYIEVIQEVDAQRFPKLAHEIRTGGMDSVSMGVEAGFTKCSVCENKATDLHDMCSHVKHSKGKYLPHVRTGERTLVYENCYKLGFFELSYVFDPADETAVVSKVLVANRRVAQVPWNHGNDRAEANMGPHGLHVFDPHWADEVDEYQVDPYNKEGHGPMLEQGFVPGAGSRQHEWVHTRNGEPINGGFAPTRETGMMAAERSYNELKDGYDPDSDPFDPRLARKRNAMRRNAYGDTTAPPDVDTLRNADDADDDHFHHYVESPKELQTPDLENSGNIRKNKGGPTDVSDFDPEGDSSKKFVESDTSHEEAIDDFLDWCDSINISPSDDSLDDFANSYHLNDEDYQAVSDFLAAEQGNGAGPTNANQPVPRTSRRKRMATYRYAEESAPLDDQEPYGEDDPGIRYDGDVEEDYGDGGGEGGYEEEAQGGDPEQLVQDFVTWCEDNGAEPTSPEALDGFDQEAQLSDEEYQGLAELIAELTGGGGEEEQGPPPSPEGDPGFGGPEQGGGEEFAQDPQQFQASNGNRNTSSQKVRRAKKGKSMARQTLASRGQDVASRQRLHRFADDNGHFDSGPYGEDNQGEQEEIFLSQTPGTEGVSAPVPGDGTISNTERNLVARINAAKNSLQQDIYSWNQIQAYKYAADGGLPDADKVDPALSGTDDQDLKGHDFERVQPEKVETQPKDASLKAFAAFDNWLHNTTGRTASQHGNANFIRRQAARWAGSYGYPVEVLFPTLGNFLRQARRIEGSTNMRRTADESLDVAAPQDRIDVEAPVKNTTDADAQASQFDLHDFGNNAGDGVADPDLSTDSQIWAPGEGVKESNRKADGVAAIRLAEAYIKAGLKPEGDKYNLVAQFQTMRHATVTDRTRLLEAVLKTAAFSRRVTAGNMNRGTAPRSPFPPGLMNGGGMSRSASVNRVAANDPSTDSDLFL